MYSTDITSSLTVGVVGRTETSNWSILSIWTAIVVLHRAKRAGLGLTHSPVNWAPTLSGWSLLRRKSSRIRPDFFHQVGATNTKSESCLCSSLMVHVWGLPPLLNSLHGYRAEMQGLAWHLHRLTVKFRTKQYKQNLCFNVKQEPMVSPYEPQLMFM